MTLTQSQASSKEEVVGGTPKSEITMGCLAKAVRTILVPLLLSSQCNPLTLGLELP